MTKRKKRDKSERAYSLGFKAGVRGHEMESCPYNEVAEERGYWFGGWREGRSNFLSGYLVNPPSSVRPNLFQQ